jgi:FkbM family methyltransferase
MKKDNQKFESFYPLLRKVLLLCLSFLNISGARELSGATAESRRVRLNRINKIGPKNCVVCVSKDKFIYRSILRYGEWEKEISEFLASKIFAADAGKSVVFLDIGANAGFITLQIAKILRRNGFRSSNFQFICIEPLTSNYNFCVSNLSEVVGGSFKWTVKKIALGDTEANSLIHVNTENYGDSSLLPFATEIDSNDEYVNVIDTKTFSETELVQFDSIILKCDTQGYDAKILARIPDVIWRRITSLVVEIESYANLQETDMELCLDRFMEFDYKSFSRTGKNRLSRTEIRQIWTSKSHSTRNLYLSRN